MSEKTHIAWTDSTVNFWSGCTKVSPGCLHCYAEARDKRHMIEDKDHWGKGAPRLKHKGAVKDALALNRKPWICPECGLGFAENIAHLTNDEWCGGNPNPEDGWHRRRVFSLSLGDWLDEEVPIEWLAEMLDTIRQCDSCDWLLLTKRPENFTKRLQDVMMKYCKVRALATGEPTDILWSWLAKWWNCSSVPKHIWIGTSTENQEQADKRIPELLKIPAAVRFLSVEPMLSAIHLNLGEINYDRNCNGPMATKPAIDWCIFGGESGKGARLFDEENAVHGIDQCRAAGVKAFFKQFGSNAYRNGNRLIFKDPKGGDMYEWPEDLRVREFPTPPTP